MINNIVTHDLTQMANGDLPWEKFSNKRIYVSGANGFLPAYMIDLLLFLNDKNNFNIKVLAGARSIDNAKNRFKNYLHRDDFELILHEVSQPLKIDKADKKIDYIIHAASQASPKYYSTDPVGTLSANVLGTHHLLKLAKEHDVEGFMYFSSGEVYGQLGEGVASINEEDYGVVDPLEVRSCYAESKKMGEAMCVAWHHQFNIPAKIVRPFHTYGPGMRLDDGRVFADFVRNIIGHNNIVLHSDGSAIRAFCYLSDAVLGFFYVLLNGRAAQAYNIGNPDCAVSIRELATLLVDLFHERKLKVVYKERDLQQLSYLASPIKINCPDISKAKELGWRPTTSLKEGFYRTVKSFES